MHNGKIAGIGATVEAPASAAVVDAAGKYVTPGLIDPHSHSALGDDVNEATSPVTPALMMVDAFDNTDKALYQALAGGVTTELLLHGSANMIGGQAVVIKNKFGLSRDAMLFPDAPRSIKFASGENPKRVYGNRNESPSTRMGNFAVMRQAFEDAKTYTASWDAYNAKLKKGDKDAVAPKRDLKLDALADVLSGKLFVQIHCYRADEFLTEEALAREYGYKIRAFHHALEMYKVGDKIAPTGTAIATFADWWGYKEALKMITINPAWIIGVDDRVGSIDTGKDADLVIWDKDPLSSYARAEKVYIDGDLFFDSSQPGFGTPHFNGAMHEAGFGGAEDDGGGQ
jgi:imidazolonepropionase-like amidohydrolase